MEKYLTLWLKMQPNTWHTAKELNIAPATMAAMVRRGIVTVKDTVPKQYKRIRNELITILYLVEKHKNEMSDFIGIYKTGEKLGMLCSIKNEQVYDCWEQLYDVTGANIIRIGKYYYNIDKGKRIIK